MNNKETRFFGAMLRAAMFALLLAGVPAHAGAGTDAVPGAPPAAAQPSSATTATPPAPPTAAPQNASNPDTQQNKDGPAKKDPKDQAPVSGEQYVRVRATTNDGGVLWAEPLADEANKSPAPAEQAPPLLRFTAKPEQKSALQLLVPGDELRIIATGSLLEDFEPMTAHASKADWRESFGVSAGLFLLLVTILVGSGALIGVDKRASKSTVQVSLWFSFVVSAYCGLFLLRGLATHWGLVGGINIPTNLLAISGLSAATFVGAKVIGVRVNKPGSDAPSTGFFGHLKELASGDDGRPDLADIQMLVMMFVAGSVWLVQLYHYSKTVALVANTSLPDVDSTLLAITGLAQGGYVGKKLADATKT